MIRPVIRHVAIVGGGFSGALLAINLLRHDGPRATLVERRPAQLGRGVAYSAAHEDHLLNVRAGNMSALPDDPDHFVRWLTHNALGDRTTFVPRRVYGRYLREMLEAAAAAHPHRLTLVEDAVGAIAPDGTLTLGNGGTLAADAVVLALGNLPPHTPPGLDPDALPAHVYRGDPWAGDIAAGLTDDDTVLLVGSGLTAVDAALLLDSSGFRGRTLAVSRRGLAPRRHADAPARPGLSERPAATLSALLRHVRTRSDAIGWRAAVDELRPVTQMMWGAADAATRARFLRHLRPWWDVHRHRLAPAVADRIDALVAGGRLEVAAGKLVAAHPDGDHAIVDWRARGTSGVRRTRVARIVNCTGPQGDLLRTDEPLLRDLLGKGMIRPDALRIGLEVDAQSRVVDAAGRAAGHLYAIGPMTRGGLWEVVAVPDIRQQNWTLARRLANAQWVGGEGL
ncbi:putative NAD(P)/FAD-binding protein YdhS [Sphingomonas sp. BE138]|uniref:FAD/NAD(P)-binding protein n=1 Tax=Sphingomonas sp. BE138 TaxID=2817845 RepID=UPI00285FE122|nr:FAD/NAD(P)-binding protein [Sphingomonas sp. BE138]MDR6787444.1 putative NAD(P)/FAD-binding protein YdhS [Sphingomonas sp. BE138]